MHYRYTATDVRTGEKVTQVEAADSVATLINRIKSKGLLPVNVSEADTIQKVKTGLKFLPGSVSPKELVVFTRQLAATLTSGLLLTEALETIGEDLENQYFRRVIEKIRKDIRGGEDFSQALAKHPKVFPKTYIAIMKSGEATGRLDHTTKSLAKYLEDSERLKEKVKAAVRYPTFVVCFAIVVVLVMVLFLIPKFAAMFEEFHAELPLLTRIVVGISNFMLHQTPLFVAILFVIGLSFWIGMKYSKFRYAMDVIKFKIPILGKHVIQKGMIARFCRTFGFLLAGGVGLASALDITSRVVNHLPTQDAIDKIRTRVMAGSAISTELRKQKVFPKLVAKMANVGEKSGELSAMFNKTGEYYEEELDATLNSLTTMLEPVLIVFVGVIVLVVVLALYLPIFQMAQVIR
jgi:type IV pilus assembly protein PilC